MAKMTFSETINVHFRRCEWAKARKLLEAERAKHPDDHWLLTQLGVTYYEEHEYDAALQLLLSSLKIVGDCPLTLWNLGGTFDALGRHTDAAAIYTWLLESEKSPDDDSCWESRQWSDALKTDCVFRLAACFENLGKQKRAEHGYRKYLDLLLIGAQGTYSIENVTHAIRRLSSSSGRRTNGGAVRKALRSAIQNQRRESRRRPPRFDERGLLTGRRAASKA